MPFDERDAGGSGDHQLAFPGSSALARALHDGVVQRLSSVNAALGSDAPLAPDDRRRCQKEVEAALSGLRELISGALQGPRTDVPRTVSAAVREACAEYTDVPLEARYDGDAEIVPDVANLIRDFVAEAIRNAVKHGRPTAVWVFVRVSGEEVSITVWNDGLSAASNGTGTGLGLRLLATDAARCGGRIDARQAGKHRWRTALALSLNPSSRESRRFDRGSRYPREDP